MSYHCKQCDKYLKLAWCDKCQVITEHTCTDFSTVRHKDVILTDGNHERTVTVYADMCTECGDIMDVRT